MKWLTDLLRNTTSATPGKAGGQSSNAQVNTADIEERIRDFFEENFEALRLEGDRSLAPEVKEAALQQVLLYWRKLREIALKVTDTEVRLNLPHQKTPKGRTYSIEGVVDIVRERDVTIMYDIKTHDADAIRNNLGEYERQLNVYAHIWQSLRGEELDAMAVICTRFPAAIKEALEEGDEARVERELPRWNPVIDVEFDEGRVRQTIAEFGQVVDLIEDSAFAPAPVEKLKAVRPGERAPFAVAVCRNCDARFSCSSYRTYALGAGGLAERRFREYVADVGDEAERDSWLTATLDAAPAADAFADIVAAPQDED
jgi:hypothetical protein